MMSDSRRQAFFHLIAAPSALGATARKVDLAISWGQSSETANTSSVEGLVRIQRDLDKAMAASAREIASFK